MMFIKAISEFSRAIPAILVAVSLAAASGRAGKSIVPNNFRSKNNKINQESL